MTSTTISTLATLPTDILVAVFEPLSIGDLAALALTCRSLQFAVNRFGWTTHILSNPRFAPSVLNTLSTWDARAQVRYHTLSDLAWATDQFIARPISPPWRGKLQPLLAISPTRLIVAAGSALYSYAFTSSSYGTSPSMQFEGLYTWHNHHDSRKDITGLAFAPDGGLDRTLYVGFGHGALERVVLLFYQSTEITQEYKTEYDLHGGELVQSLSSRDDLLLSVSINGTASLSNFSNPESPFSHTIELQTRSWSTYIPGLSRTSYAAFGTSSTTPLSVHDITDSELSRTPSAILGKTDGTQENQKPCAVYGICGTPLSAHWGSDQVIVSGWYDGFVRVHDLRSSRRAIPAPGSPVPAPLLPVLSFCDPWSLEPIYSVATGGGFSNHIAAGSARHSVVAFWDVRLPRKGWSIHAPGNDPSPVYSLIVESSRVFGATQSRPFVYDYGPGVTKDTYPALPNRPTQDRQLEYKQDGLGVAFYVTKYTHARPRYRT